MKENKNGYSITESKRLLEKIKNDYSMPMKFVGVSKLGSLKIMVLTKDGEELKSYATVNSFEELYHHLVIENPPPIKRYAIWMIAKSGDMVNLDSRLLKKAFSDSLN